MIVPEELEAWKDQHEPESKWKPAAQPGQWVVDERSQDNPLGGLLTDQVDWLKDKHPANFHEVKKQTSSIYDDG